LLIAHKGKYFRLNESIEVKTEVNIRSRGEEKRSYSLDPQIQSKMTELFVGVKSTSNSVKKFKKMFKQKFDLLIELGVLIPAEKQAVKVLAKNCLDETGLAFIPEMERKYYLNVSANLVFNRNMVFTQKAYDRPKTKFHGLPPKSHFPKFDKLVWIFDPGTGMWTFFSVSKKILLKIDDLSKGKVSLKELDPVTREIFYHARILVEKTYLAKRKTQWDELQRVSRKVRERGWTVIREVLSPFQIANLARYSKNLYEEGYLFCDEKQVDNKRRFYCIADQLCDFFNRQGGTLVRHSTGEPCFPSWAIFSAYLRGAELKRHIDRDLCAWNVSMPIFVNDNENPWPLMVQNGKSRPQKMMLKAGDIAIYRGGENFHWRPRLKGKNLEIIMLWFYVPVNFMGEIQT
jgi:hypothetical protein